MTTETKNKVAIYVRVSTSYQVDKDSLPMQRQDLIAYSKLILNTDDYVIFEDAGYSGKNTDRPKFQEMMAQIRQGVFTHLLVWKIDRISRNLLDFSTMYKELKDLGVVFVSKNEQFDTSTAMGEAMLKIILVFAELERNMTSERVTATMISRASNGIWNGGRVPYGYDYDSESKSFSVNQSEADVVRLIHDRYELLGSLVQEARLLNEMGLRTRAGNLWNPVSLHIILHNVFYCGDYRYNVLKEGSRQKIKDESEWITVASHHPSIISKEQKDRILIKLKTNQRNTRSRGFHKTEKHIHIFSGMVKCSSCGRFMNSSPVGRKSECQYSKYSCNSRRKLLPSCNCKGTSDPILGEFVFNYILNILNAQKSFDNISSPIELQSFLLSGMTFSYIDHIEQDGLNDLYNMLSVGAVKGTVFGKSSRTKKKTVSSELSKLRNEKAKLQRALDRLTNLYLYSEDAMSESDFIIKKSRLIESINELNDQIGFANSEELCLSVSDEDLIRRASEFILVKKLDDRNYISYKRIASSVDASVIESFVKSTIDSITMTNGKVHQIIFKNGLSNTFVFK